MAGRPTIRDVAELAGVHPGTASRALDPRLEGRIAAATAERVRAAARRLGYVPDPVARTLRAGRSAVVGVVVPDLANPVFPPIVQGIEDTLADAGYVALVANTGNDLDREHARFAALRSRRCDGYIVASATLTKTRIGDLADSGNPVVLVNRETSQACFPSVSSDDRPGVEAALEHLAGLGHRAVAHITGPPDLSVVQTRAQAFQSAARRLGLDLALVRHCPALGVSEARAAALALLAEAPATTAILAGNDLMALGCYAAADQAGRSCPDGLSVVGYNDMPVVEWWRPPLTTVRIPQYEIGCEAATMMLGLMGAGPGRPARQILLPVALQVRGSTAPAPERAASDLVRMARPARPGGRAGQAR